MFAYPCRPAKSLLIQRVKCCLMLLSFCGDTAAPDHTGGRVLLSCFAGNLVENKRPRSQQAPGRRKNNNQGVQVSIYPKTQEYPSHLHLCWLQQPYSYWHLWPTPFADKCTCAQNCLLFACRGNYLAPVPGIRSA
jgi:hypothetical protein